MLRFLGNSVMKRLVCVYICVDINRLKLLVYMEGDQEVKLNKILRKKRFSLLGPEMFS